MYTIKDIENKLVPVMRRYDVKKAVLFGSYSRGTARKNSDIDILVDSGLKGFGFVSLIEDIRNALDTDVDVLDVSHIVQGSLIEREINRTGVTVYDKRSSS